MLMVDQTLDVVTRYDPVTGTKLGTFGGLQLVNPQSVSLIPGTGDCFVYDSAIKACLRFNYSTGQYISSITVPTAPSNALIASPFSDGSVLLWGYLSSFAIRMSASGALLNTYTLPSGTSSISGAAVGPSNEVYIACRGIDRIQRYQMNGTAQSLSATSTLVYSNGAQMAVGSSLGYWTNSSSDISRFIPGNPALPVDTISIPNVTLYGAALGHGDLAYFCGADTTGTGLIIAYDGKRKLELGRIVTGAGTIPIGMAVVTAPEPASCAFLALGMGALALRRRRRAC